MSESCNHDCSSCSSNCKDRESDFKISLNKKSSVKKVIGIVSGKGGVGKSLVTSLMAVYMQRENYNTAILDGDITGPSIPKVFGIDQMAYGTEEGILPSISECGTQIMSTNLMLENNTDPVIYRGPVIANMVKQFYTDVIYTDVDFMFVDMPPGTGDVALTVFQSLPVDGIIIVTTPQDLVSMIVEKAINMANMMNINILGIVENMSYVECDNCDHRINIFGESKIADICKKYNIDQLGTIPMNVTIASLCDAGNIEAINKNYLDSAVLKLKSL